MTERSSDPAKPREVTSGVWTIPVAFPSPLEHTNCYLLPGEQGLILVDAGWESEQSWADLNAGISAAGAQLSDIVGVVITHIHPDHVGLASRLRESTSAWLGMHPLEAERIPTHRDQLDKSLQLVVEWLESVGAPQSEIDSFRDDGPAIAARASLIRPDKLIRDGERVPGTRALTAIHTPGHTRGHLCFFEESRRVLFTGDHLLPRVTPNVSQRPHAGEDPLGHFQRSVAKTRGLGATLGLPGHEWVIHDLDTRIDMLAVHHSARLDEIEAAVREGAHTVWEVATSVHWSRPWNTLSGLQMRSAIGETHSHLERLARQDRVRHEQGRPARWMPTRVTSRSALPSAWGGS